MGVVQKVPCVHLDTLQFDMLIRAAAVSSMLKIFVPNLWVSRVWHHFPYLQRSSGSRDQEVGKNMQGDYVD